MRKRMAGPALARNSPPGRPLLSAPRGRTPLTVVLEAVPSPRRSTRMRRRLVRVGLGALALAWLAGLAGAADLDTADHAPRVARSAPVVGDPQGSQPPLQPRPAAPDPAAPDA